MDTVGVNRPEIKSTAFLRKAVPRDRLSIRKQFVDFWTILRQSIAVLSYNFGNSDEHPGAIRLWMLLKLPFARIHGLFSDLKHKSLH
jgi:hypothetical protein